MDQDRVFPGISADSVGLRLFRPKQPIEALGLAVDHLLIKPAFASLPFGEWSRFWSAKSIAVITSSRSTTLSAFNDSSAGGSSRALKRRTGWKASMC